jgi:hypothetical protein
MFAKLAERVLPSTGRSVGADETHEVRPMQCSLRAERCQCANNLLKCTMPPRLSRTGTLVVHSRGSRRRTRRAIPGHEARFDRLGGQARAWGLTNRRGRPLTSQAIGMLLRNQLYAGIVDVPEYGVRGKRGDFEPLISEDLFYRVQSVLSGRLPSTAPRQRAHPDFPLRAFVRCEVCGLRLTGSWSNGLRIATNLRNDASRKPGPNRI